MVAPLVLVGVLLVAGCQSASAPGGGGGGESSWHPLFHDPIPGPSPDDRLAELIEQGKFDDAGRLFREQRDYFAAHRANAAPLLKRLAGHVNDRNGPALKAALSGIRSLPWPATPAQWPAMKRAMAAAAKSIEELDRTAILNDPEFAPPEAAELRRATGDLQERSKQGALGYFLVSDHESAGNFFDDYPAALDAPAFFTANSWTIAKNLSAAGPGKIEAFFAKYREAGRVPELAVLINDQTAAPAGTGEGLEPLEKLIAMAQAKESGRDLHQPGALPGIAFVEATSKTLLRHGQIDFPASIDVDLPVNFSKAGLDETMSLPATEEPRYVIIFDVALAKASRRVLNLRQVPSSAFIGFDGENRVVRPAGPSTAGGGANQDNKTTVMETPEALDIFEGKAVGAPLFVRYNFNKARIQARKTMTVNYYVVDRRQGTYFQSLFDVSEEERFEVAYDIEDADPKKNIHREALDTEKEVDEFEKAPAAVKLSQLLRHYAANRGEAKRLASLDELRQNLLAKKNEALARYEEERYDARPLNDPRFDNVVVVYLGDGALGSGFYVKSDVIITNWHVVENQKIIEMKLYDGNETYGTVLGKDVRLDLALIKVQHHGKPVKFHSGRNLEPGRTVEAIGHPGRHEFSITRGIVSAVRHHPSINLPKGAGDEVLYVQTDAPINHGNSGGPLFLDDRVIGMNTWGYAASDGLNFSVHYSEITRFLNEHLPGFHLTSNEAER